MAKESEKLGDMVVLEVGLNYFEKMDILPAYI